MPTKINYLDELWSPITGCSGKGCKTKETCWARDMVRRFPVIHGYVEPYDADIGDYETTGYHAIPGQFSTVQFHPDRLDKPLHWRKPRRIGVCFMGDLFDEQVPFEWFKKILGIIFHSKPTHKFYFLTKQPATMRKQVETWLSEYYNERSRWHFDNHLKNIFWGISITDQPDADRMIPELLKIPGKRWLSIEPCMGDISLELICPHGKDCQCNGDISCCQRGLNSLTGELKYYDDESGEPCSYWGNAIDWVVLGCHNNQKRHPFKLEWAYSIRDQCRAAGVKLWIKQLPINNKCCTDINQFPEGLRIRDGI